MILGMNCSLRIGIFASLAKAAINVPTLFLLVTIRSLALKSTESESEEKRRERSGLNARRHARASICTGSITLQKKNFGFGQITLARNVGQVGSILRKVVLPLSRL